MLHTGNEVYLKKRNSVNIYLEAQGYTESVLSFWHLQMCLRLPCSQQGTFFNSQSEMLSLITSFLVDTNKKKIHKKCLQQLVLEYRNTAFVYVYSFVTVMFCKKSHSHIFLSFTPLGCD